MIARLERALDETRIEGVRTSVPLFRQILRDPQFRAGEADNAMLDRKLASGEWGAAAEADAGDLPLVAALIEHASRQSVRSASPAPRGGQRSGWRTAGRREALRRPLWGGA